MGQLLYSEDCLYNKDPSIEPWGTPYFILPRSEKVVLLEKPLFISTLWYLSLREDLSNTLVLLFNPQNSHFDNIISWFTESNAFSKSQYIPPTVNLLLSASNISFISLKGAFLVEELLLKPYRSVANIVLLVKVLV